MKTFKLLFILLVPFLIQSCAPKVVTHITKTYQPSVTTDQVQLYGVGQEVPAKAEVIGNISVVDNSASTKCNYEQVVALAKKETALQGGNALALTDHRKPSLLGRSCHQIAGNMLLIGDGIPYDTALARNTTEMMSKSKSEKTPFQHSTIYANIGYAFITSKFYLPQGTTGNPTNGLDWQLGYEWVSRSGFGAGLMYSGYKSSYSYAGFNSKMGITYVAPQFVMKQLIGRWILQENFGIGYLNYHESAERLSESLSGVGFNLSLGGEYLLSKHVGIGVNIGYVGGSLPKQEYMEYGENEHSGISRLNFDAGLRFHF